MLGKMAKVSTFVELILDTKCSAENKERVVIASDQGAGASYSVGKESPCAVVTSEPRPERRDGARHDSMAVSALVSQRTGASHLRTHCRQMVVFSVSFF